MEKKLIFHIKKNQGKRLRNDGATANLQTSAKTVIWQRNLNTLPVTELMGPTSFRDSFMHRLIAQLLLSSEKIAIEVKHFGNFLGKKEFRSFQNLFISQRLLNF